MPFCGLIYREDCCYERAREELEKAFSHLSLESPSMSFSSTTYYAGEMGWPLQRRFVVFSKLVSPACLAAAKHTGNRLEELLAESGRRRVNIDPGYISQASLVIATTKNFAHRVPLQDGIYAHLEYIYRDRAYQLLDWTYPDFRSPEYRAFFARAREILLEKLREQVK